MKKTFYSELAYILGLIVLAFGTAFMERANFGMSMVVAPAYLIYLKISTYLPWFTFGISEYCFQALLLIVLILATHKFQAKYLFSFITAFLYGNILDVVMKLTALIPGTGFAACIVFYVLGLLVCALGVSLLFHTYLAPEAYELVVIEISAKYDKDIHKVKTVYDLVSCLMAVLMSFFFIGLWKFEGVKLGTILCALVNGFVIGRFSHALEKHFTFKDAFRKKVSLGDGV